MLVELRDVEVHLEPEEILTQALQEGDITIDAVVQECIAEEDADAVLNAVENEDIQDYCERHSISNQTIDFEFIALAARKLTEQEQAELVWKLLKIF